MRLLKQNISKGKSKENIFRSKCCHNKDCNTYKQRQTNKENNK